ncbi:MAG: phosphatidate cytidylyltransferase [Treponema sp.]|nr:phosphatidate cytidylyltransferase [Treponema sp.]
MDNHFYNGILANQKRNNIIKEIFRKSIHLCSALVPLFLKIQYWFTISLLFLALIIYIISEILRRKGKTIPIISKITETAARKRDENKFVLGPVTLVSGILLASLILPLDCATIGIYALSFGDGLASLIGKLIGRVVIPGTNGKTVAGSLTCFFAVFISAFLFCHNCLISLILGTFAMFIEVLPLKDFDNLVIPIFIGSIYFLL